MFYDFCEYMVKFRFELDQYHDCITYFMYLRLLYYFMVALGVINSKMSSTVALKKPTVYRRTDWVLAFNSLWAMQGKTRNILKSCLSTGYSMIYNCAYQCIFNVLHQIEPFTMLCVSSKRMPIFTKSRSVLGNVQTKTTW